MLVSLTNQVVDLESNRRDLIGQRVQTLSPARTNSLSSFKNCSPFEKYTFENKLLKYKFEKYTQLAGSNAFAGRHTYRQLHQLHRVLIRMVSCCYLLGTCSSLQSQLHTPHSGCKDGCWLQGQLCLPKNKEKWERWCQGRCLSYPPWQWQEEMGQESAHMVPHKGKIVLG